MGENEKKVHQELERIRKVNPDYFKGSSKDVVKDGKQYIELKPSQFFIDVITAASKDAKQED
tara:strand:+ start:305 stop:490 length:186 start_codon:yes stop_codon:yes gene_type:complete